MIYLDFAAATPVSRKALEAMRPYFTEEFFNPSSAYLPAKKVAADYEAAKSTIAHCVGAKGTDLVITAGATEANNLAFTSLTPRGFEPTFSSVGLEFSGTSYAGRPGEPSPTETNLSASSGIYIPKNSNHFMLQKKQVSNPRVLYLITEHDSVRRVAERYGGKAIRVLSSGVVDLADLKSKITDTVELVSISLVNNELGTIQPLAEVAAILREIKIDRMRRGVKRQLLLHSDASQALNLLDVNVARMGIDLMTLNSAKVYGPKGVGALYVSHDARLQPLVAGGGQEKGLRSGTENVPGVIGFAAAIDGVKKHVKSNRTKYQEMRQILLSELQGYELVNKKHVIDNFVVLCYNGLDAERLVFLLEERGIYVATGAACAASKGVRSHVLSAIGLTDSQIAGSLRLSLGELNDTAQMHEAARIINEVVAGEQERINKNPNA